MEQKLTAAIAASYFGADVICAPYGGQPNRKITGTMIGLNNHGMEDRVTGQHDMKPVEVIDYLRSRSYNIGYGKYTAQDLVNEGVVIIDTKNKGI